MWDGQKGFYYEYNEYIYKKGGIQQVSMLWNDLGAQHAPGPIQDLAFRCLGLPPLGKPEEGSQPCHLRPPRSAGLQRVRYASAW